jgi:putative transposase
MPRVGRLHIPGGCYHVIGRGLERRHIFDGLEDKLDFLWRLEKNLDVSGAQCLAWALMSNHYHLLIRVGAAPLARLMAPVLGGFASSYNRRHERSGYVFQNRFQSILCQEEDYFLELVRYIHLNPVRAGVINSLAELDAYPWTGHSALMGNTVCSWLAGQEVMNHFADQANPPTLSYRAFIAAGISGPGPNLSGGGLVRSYNNWEAIAKLRKEHISCIGDERILGSGEFVESVISQDDLQIDHRTLRQREGWNFETLRRRICLHFGLPDAVIHGKSRADSASKAKSLLCFWAVNELGLTVSAVAQNLDISQQAASKRVKQGARLCVDGAMAIDDLG